MTVRWTDRQTDANRDDSEMTVRWTDRQTDANR